MRETDWMKMTSVGEMNARICEFTRDLETRKGLWIGNAGEVHVYVFLNCTL